jgi:hypothetical protein
VSAWRARGPKAAAGAAEDAIKARGSYAAPTKTQRTFAEARGGRERAGGLGARALGARARVLEEAARAVEHEGQFGELPVRAREALRVAGELQDLGLEAREARLELVERHLRGAAERRAGREARARDLGGEEAQAPAHLVAALDLGGKGALEGGAAGREVAELEEAQVAERGGGGVRGLGGDQELHELHLLGAEELHLSGGCGDGLGVAARRGAGRRGARDLQLRGPAAA